LAINVGLIGTCETCEFRGCTKPKIKRLNPERGCTDWTTAAVKAFRKTIKTETVEKVEI